VSRQIRMGQPPIGVFVVGKPVGIRIDRPCEIPVRFIRNVLDTFPSRRAVAIQCRGHATQEVRIHVEVFPCKEIHRSVGSVDKETKLWFLLRSSSEYLSSPL